MTHLTTVLRAATAAALMGSFAYLGIGIGIGTASAEPDNGNPADVDTLAESLSKGYDLTNCAPQPINPGELAELVCDQTADSAGPAEARYILFANTDAMNGKFKAGLNDETLTSCGESQSPTTWHQGTSGTAGQVACGTHDGAAEIIWTTDAKNVLSDIRGANTDVPSLYRWWQNNG
ncbi:hypothetical protein MM1218R_00676 [Mycobacterium marinum]|uniref:serine/threonine protein kinase n=1 Tax=Mycobacterium marinum TaxID=1781 RepID=UPI000E28BAEF|nr:serine/threonine protein kinase [Mycobacterium marinum]AXN42630.1 hypothetical protein MM1218R_00676 [Mycobacterium marinum]RFZ08587.1 hypothetical protein DE4381_02255 [Mycobacterium marinum]